MRKAQNNKFVQYLQVGAQQISHLATVEQKRNVKSKMFGFSTEHEHREQIALLLVRAYNCRLQFAFMPAAFLTGTK